jgi:predicted Zn-dependent protease
MIFNENDAKRFLENVLKYSKADSIDLTLTGNNIYNLRFALNSLSTNGYSDGLSLSITSNIGKKSGSVNLNKFEGKSIKEAVEKSEQIAKLSPDNKEFMPPLEPQNYLPGVNYVKDTEELSVEKRAEMLIYPIGESDKNDVVSAGYVEDGVSFTAILNSNGLFAYNKGTLAEFSCTSRTKDGTGSSRVQKQSINSNDLNTNSLGDRVISRSLLSMNPKEIKPGKYTVVLEPAAAADMIAYCTYFMGARGADEGRSFFSKPGGGNKIGENLVSEKVTIYSDPADGKAPSIPFTDEGYPRSKTFWFENGVLKNLSRGRFWAEKTSQPVVPFFSNLLMEGTSKSTEDLIASTEKGILVTRFWYIRTVDPRTVLLTGLTRDGLFEITDGKITGSVKNFRFNESPVNVLENVIDFGTPENAVGSETGNLQIFVPALKVKDFYFSSLSDAI